MSRIRIVESCGSTNDDLLADPNAVEGDWLVARRQVAGKGRQGRAWIDDDGNFLGSTIVEARGGDPMPQSLSMVASLALVEAIDVAVPDQPLLLKWPNDLLLNGAKLAGILLERRGERIVVGIGVNLASAPDVPGRRTAHLGGAVTPEAFAPILAQSMARMLDLWRSSTPQLFAQAWLARAHPVGTMLKVHDSDGAEIAGSFDGLGDDGSLRLRVAGGELKTIHAGDVDLA